MKKFGSMDIYNGELFIGGKSCASLAGEYKTPLYIIDEEGFENQVNLFLDNFKSELFQSRVIYASKAFTNIYMVSIVKYLGLYLDVVSGGELYTALEANFEPEKIYFHGNNKLRSEIDMAIRHGVGSIVIDNEDEFDLLSELLEIYDKKVRVLVRINPGVEAHTHEYIQTTKEDSKFGMPIDNQRTQELIKRIINNKRTKFAGIHSHIGSQVFEEESFFKAGELILKYAKRLSNQLNTPIEEVNLGGGFGVYYTEEDKPLELDSFLQKYITFIETTIKTIGLDLEIVSIEPGRSLINDFGSTLYTVGSIKEMDKADDYVFIDGGMSDNPRPALYKAKYQACAPSRINEPANKSYTIAGKCCESGDVLVKNIKLPEMKTGDLILIPSTGAYTYSMSSNYNRIEKPAVVFVYKGGARLGVRRESYEDLVQNDVKLMKGE